MTAVPRGLRALAVLSGVPDGGGDEGPEEDFALLLMAALELPDVRAAIAAIVWQNKPSPTPATRGTRRGR